jgi:hypothetical protein
MGANTGGQAGRHRRSSYPLLFLLEISFSIGYKNNWFYSIPSTNPKQKQENP